MEGILLSHKYKITRLINGGSFCKLYEAIHIYKNQKVAIKCESSELGKKVLENEINMYMYLKKYKINIPNIKDIGIYENYKYIVMELLNITLKEYLTPKSNIENMKKIIHHVFELIKPFHQRGLVHRDIKSENFIFDKKWNIYIIDLGLSTYASDREMTTFIGNKLYASYTCHLSEYIYTKYDDLRSIVYMLLHLYTGILPWDNENIMLNPETKYYNSRVLTKEYLNYFHSKEHSLLYNLKKNTNYEEFYKSNKYDENVEHLIYIYNNLK